MQFCFFSSILYATIPWGFYAHKQANRYTVITLREAVEGSFNALDSVLDFDKVLSAEYEQDKQYSYDKSGQKTIKQKSAEFSTIYHVMLDGIIERRLRLSIKIVGDLCYSAWVDASQPVLEGMMESDISFVEEIKIDHKITSDASRGHHH